MREIMIRRNAGRKRRGGAGQSLVEFSLILFPLFFVLLGIIQFGFIFNTYVTMTNAARDAARMGTIYVYDRSSGQTKATNDLLRNESDQDRGPRVDEHAGQDVAVLLDDRDVDPERRHVHERRPRVTYVLPTGVTDSETRVGQQITVRATYHQDLIVPLISAFLPKDANGRMTLIGEVTMVIN